MEFSTNKSFLSKNTTLSSGSIGLDYFLGGGFPIHSINLIEEDDFGILSNLLIYSFISNQLYNMGNVIVALPKKTKDFLKFLPAKKMNKLNEKNLDLMKIAWRYNNLPNIEEKSLENDNFRFDFANKLNENELKNLILCTHTELFDQLNFLISENKIQSHLTLVILNYFSFLNQIDEKIFFLHFYKLKSLSRKQKITIIITGNTEIISQQIYNYCFNLFDSVLSIEQINQEKNIYKDYNGLIKIQKLPKTNFLNYTTLSETMDIGIKLIENRRYLIVDKLHLPPELSETANRTCSSKIEF